MRYFPRNIALTLTPSMILNGWTMLSGMLFFVWPVVAGIPTLTARLIWIACTFTLSIVSIITLKRALKNAPAVTFRISRTALSTFIFLSLSLAFYASTLPPFTFSDELTISLAGLTIAKRLASIVTAPLLPIITVAGAWAFVALCKKLTFKRTIVVLALMAFVSVATALLDVQSGLAVRYPPVVHVLQTFGSMLSLGSSAWLRVPNALWLFLLGCVVWHMTDGWRPYARAGLLAAMVIGPLGWTYRIVLYQACGEITLGLAAVFLLHSTLQEKDRTDLPAYLGMTLGTWFLYRPTALAAIGIVLVTLLLLRRVRSMIFAGGIALPVATAWLLLAPLYTAQYGFVGEAGPAPTYVPVDPFHPLLFTLESLPENLHPLGLAVLLITSFVVFVSGTATQRKLLGIAWLLALAVSIPQQYAAGKMFHGLPRLNILMLLPQGIAIGSLLSGTRLPTPLHKVLGGTAIAALLVITPFDFVLFTQSMRAGSRDIPRTTSEGVTPLPLLKTVRTVLTYTKTPVILAPDYQFLDVFIAEGLLTREERDAIVERSNAWTPENPARPVIVQAPISTTYTPNRTPPEERRLRAAHVWAVKQPGYVVERLGIEETVTVP